MIDERIAVGDIVQHFKREILSEEEKKRNIFLYKVLGLAIHAETDERLVIYQAMYAPFETYVRPYDMFISKVDKNNYSDIKQTYRFETKH